MTTTEQEIENAIVLFKEKYDNIFNQAVIDLTEHNWCGGELTMLDGFISGWLLAQGLDNRYNIRMVIAKYKENN